MLTANGSRMSRRLGFRLFNAHDFTNLRKKRNLPNSHQNPIFGYALLADGQFLRLSFFVKSQQLTTKIVSYKKHSMISTNVALFS